MARDRNPRPHKLAVRVLGVAGGEGVVEAKVVLVVVGDHGGVNGTTPKPHNTKTPLQPLGLSHPRRHDGPRGPQLDNPLPFIHLLKEHPIR
jgi:hypothetical protein